MSLEKLQKQDFFQEQEGFLEENREKEQKLENFKLQYKPVIKLREQKYFQDIEKNEKAEAMRPALETHNEIVQEYSWGLTEKMLEKEKMDKKQSVVARTAVILHDCGKLSSSLLEHHQKSSDYAEKIMDELIKENILIEGVDFSKDVNIEDKMISIKTKVKQAVERHMNHPFLIKLNKGARFPEPQDIIDKTVFDSDMLANIGFKNVFFRLINEDFKKTDQEIAKEEETSYIQAVFDNVIDAKEIGVKDLKEVMLTDEGKQKAEKLINQVCEIYNNLDFDFLQRKIEQENLDAQGIKQILNKEIIDKGSEFNNTNNFIM